ncbi:MAG: beta-glucosidase BglX [Chitinophagaceae bacterium]
MKPMICLIVAVMLVCNIQAQVPIYKDPKQTADSRLKDLMKRMTIEEKAGQLNQLNGGFFTGPALNDPGQKAKMQMVRDGKIGSFLNVIGAKETRAIQEIAVKESRLGIPILFALDVIHGYKTIFPIPLAEACSWDLSLMEKSAGIAAKEASSAGIHWTFAPMCDISNDPRWGRVMEGAGEDPWLGARIAAARVKGFQGNLNDTEHILSCVKHFAAYGAVEGGKEYNNVDVSRVALWNKYLPPYEAAVKAGAATVMNSFNVFEGVPASGNKYLVTDILKKKWGFGGIVVSDWASFGEMIPHGYAADEKDAALKAMLAGSDMDMEAQVTIKNLAQLVKEGKVSMQAVDDAVSRVLKMKFKLGLFDDPYRFSDEAREKANLFTADNRTAALEGARRSIVLLKNEKNTLPLAFNGKKIALIGSFADSKDDMLDFWIAQGEAKNCVSIREGLQNRFGNSATIHFAAGYGLDGVANEALIKEAVALAETSEVLLVNIGLSGKMAGEDRALAFPEIPATQIALLQALKKTGKPIIALVSSGRPLVLTAIEPLADAIVQCWILGTETGNAVADILSGAYNPSAKTVMTFPYAIGQIPVYYNAFNTGRPIPEGTDPGWKSRYRDIPNKPLYPFGYGLSYTTFSYGGFSLDKSSAGKNESVQVTVTVTNSGSVAGEEIVQLYIRDVAASIVRPVKELKNFQKISLKPGESRTVKFILLSKDLSYSDATGLAVLEPGLFKIMVGGNSRDVLEKELTIK